MWIGKLLKTPLSYLISLHMVLLQSLRLRMAQPAQTNMLSIEHPYPRHAALRLAQQAPVSAMYSHAMCQALCR